MNYEKKYRALITLPDKITTLNTKVKCPFHPDDTASLSINLDKGIWHCFGCGKSGNYQQFKKALVNGINCLVRKDTIEEREKEKIEDEKTLIEDSVVTAFHERLLVIPSVLQWLRDKRGLPIEVVRQFKLGHDGKRITIPIADEQGRWINIRRYMPNSTVTQEKMLSYKPGTGKAALFPIMSILRNKVVLLLEGEMDCLLGNWVGFNSVTVTGGAGTWRNSWNSLFTDKAVYICYDRDVAGMEGSHKIALQLSHYARDVFIIDLPLTEPKGADFTDYIVGHGHTKVDFQNLMDSALKFQVITARPKEIEETIHDIHLSQASHKRYTYRRIRTRVMVVGKILPPYVIPSKIKVVCQMGKSKCDECPLAEAKGEKELVIEKDDPNILDLLDINTRQLNDILKRVFGIPDGCKSMQLDVTDHYNVEMLLVAPEIDFTIEDSEYLVRAFYSVGHGVQSNRTYLLTGVSLPDPKTQHSTTLLYQVEPSQASIDRFRDGLEDSNTLDGVRQLLSIFQIASCAQLADKVLKVHKNLGKKGRKNVHKKTIKIR